MSMELKLDGGGKLKIWEDAGRVFFRCEREFDSEGIYKVWIWGDAGELMLGTLVPEGERLVLGRAIWQMELRRSGCWPIRGGRIRLAAPFGNRSGDGWCWEDNPARFVDAETASLGEWCRMLVRREEGGTELAIGWHREEPIPLAALFCLARPEQIRGEVCLVWKFDCRGKPCLPLPREDKGESRAR